MIRLSAVWLERAIGAVAVWVCLALWLHSERTRAAEQGAARQQLRAAKARLTIWQDSAARAWGRVEHDTVRVTRFASRTDTLRDSVLARITDTVLVRQYVTAADSTIHACRELVSDCARFHIAADSTIHALSAQRDAYHSLYDAARPRIWGRLGVSVGYGLTLSAGQVHAGPVVAFAVKVWP